MNRVSSLCAQPHQFAPFHRGTELHSEFQDPVTRARLGLALGVLSFEIRSSVFLSQSQLSSSLVRINVGHPPPLSGPQLQNAFGTGIEGSVVPYLGIRPSLNLSLGMGPLA